MEKSRSLHQRSIQLIFKGFSVESWECAYFFWKRAMQGAESCHLVVVLRGLEIPAPPGYRGKVFSFIFMCLNSVNSANSKFNIFCLRGVDVVVEGS